MCLLLIFASSGFVFLSFLFVAKASGEEGVTTPFIGLHIYWKDGLQLDSPDGHLKLKIGGSVMIDGGRINADEELQKAFTDLEGWKADFRRLRINILATIYDTVDFKVEEDFADVREIKDIWIGLSKKLLLLGYVKIGHMKEPFSLERLTSGLDTTFMERSLPTVAFSPGRNFGFSFHNAVLNNRLTWSAGSFLNTSSFSSLGEAQDRIGEANGYNLTARITGLPWYEGDGERVLHIGFAYSYQNRNRDRSVIYRARPESFLTDDQLVNTGEFHANSANLVNSELAIVMGPLSLQGEYFHTFVNATEAGDPRFWGFYLQGSYFLTGEHRNYDTSSGVFSRVTPKQIFRPFKSGWGAWELGARLSYVDLNSAAIRGGKEVNLTLGLNWYLNPNLRFMFNYIRAHVEDRANPPVDNGRANIFQARFQFAL